AVATANIATEGGTFVTLDLGTIEPGSSVLRGPIPASARGGLLIGLGFAPTLPEVHNARPASGTLLLGPFRADTAVLRAGFASWVATGGMHLRHSAERARLSFFLTNDRDAGFRHSQPTDAGHVRAIATPSLAGIASGGGLLPVRVDDNDVVLRVAGTAERFPSTDGDFLVADESALRTLLNTSAPGSAVVREVWLDGASGRAGRELAAAVGKPPLTGVHATFQSRVEAGLRDDPLARAVLRTLAATALVAFSLALGGLLLALAEDVRDERGELEDLEAQGAGPARLRGHLRLRSTAIVGVGILGGAVLGAVLSVLVVAAVLVTANGGVPEPPLLLSVDWTLLGAGLLAYLACALVLVSLVTWNAFRREAPA
ncbi:MAG TPA: FtsX-like permease family protein, partial [Gaiellaceae bacterium]|nr:FtsX-like permease family protein [Gaiellaceae bacterium]